MRFPLKLLFVRLTTMWGLGLFRCSVLNDCQTFMCVKFIWFNEFYRSNGARARWYLGPASDNDTLRPTLSMNLSNPKTHTHKYRLQLTEFRAFSISQTGLLYYACLHVNDAILCHFPLWPEPNCKITFCLEGIFRIHTAMPHTHY